MAGVQEMTSVHRQATFETNRLKLQRGSLDLPIIDSGEESENSSGLQERKQGNQTFNAADSSQIAKQHNQKEGSKPKGHPTVILNGNSSSIDKKEHIKQTELKAKGKNNKSVSDNSSSPVQNTSKGANKTVHEKDQDKRAESKPNLQAVKTQPTNKSSLPAQGSQKASESAKDNKEKVGKSETTSKVQSKDEKSNKNTVPLKHTPKGNDSDRSIKTDEPKKAHKKLSVLSKLNANKTAETGNKQGGVVNYESKNKPSVSSKSDQQVADSVKPSPRKGVSKDENILQKPKPNQDSVKGDKDPQYRGKKGNVIFNVENVKESGKKSENLPNVNKKTVNGFNPDDKQNKTSVLKGINSKRDKSPEKKPSDQQASISGDQTVKVSAQKTPNSTNDNVIKSTKTENALKENKRDIKKEKESKANNQDQKESKHPDNTKTDTSKPEHKVQENKNTGQVNTKSPDRGNGSSVPQLKTEKQPSPRSVVNSPRSEALGKAVHESEFEVKDTEIDVGNLPINNAPVGTILNRAVEKQIENPHEKDVDTQEDIKTVNIVMKDCDDDSVPRNPLIEGIHIEQRDKKMDVRRHESYEAVYAERNTLLKAELAYRARIKQLEDEANGFLRVIEDLTSENKSLRKKIEMLENELHAEGKTNLVEKMEEMEEDNRTLKTLMKEQKEVIAQLKNAATGTDQQEEIRDLKHQIVKLQTENQTQNEENIKLKAEYYEAMKKLNSIKDVNKSQGVGKEAAMDNKTRNSIKTLQTENADLKKRIDTLEYESNTLSESLRQKKTELKEILGVMKDENKFDNERKDLQNEVLRLKKEKREKELEHVKEKRDLHDELQEKASLLTDKTTQYDELKIKADELETENGKMKSDVERLNKDKGSLQEELETLTAEVARLDRELEESKRMYSKLLSETESASKDLKETKTELEQFNRDLQGIVTEKEGQISKLIAQLDTLRQERESERKRNAEEKDAFICETERLKVFETNYLKKEKDLQSCQQKLEESDLKRKQLSITLEDKGFEVSNLQQQIFELNMKLDNYSKRVSQLDKDKRELEMDKRDWEIKKDKVNDIESSNKRLLEENKRLRNQLEITSLTSEPKSSEVASEKSPTEAWVQDKTNQQATYVNKDRPKKKVNIMAEHSVPKKRQAYTKSSPVRSNKQSQSKRHVIQVALNSSRSLEDIRKSPLERRGTPDSQPSLPEVTKDPRLTLGGGAYGGYSEIHRNRVRAAANKRVY